MHRLNILLAILVVAASVAVAHGQTATLFAGNGGAAFAWNNPGVVATGTGLTVNLTLGIEYLLVGGGGGGGGGIPGGGGGGGGVLTGTLGRAPQTFANPFYQNNSGGSGGVNNGAAAANGGNVILLGLTAFGGGAGAGSGLGQTAKNGGSGGGGVTDGVNKTAGTGTSGQGFAGGTGGAFSSFGTGAGGGGAGSSGTNANAAGAGRGGAGGAGIVSTITGASVTYGSGGGGGGSQGGGSASSGGGAGASSGAGTAGTAGVGGGGGGAYGGNGGNGGNGAAIFRYLSNTNLFNLPLAPSQISVNSQTYQLHNLIGSGEYNNVALNYTIANLFATQSTAITGTGRLTFNSAGTLILTASNTYSGGTTISAGTLQVGNSGTTGALGPGTVTNNATLTFNRSDTVAFTDGITGTGNLVKQGGSILELTAANTYAGTTTISSGTLQIGGGGTEGTLGSGAVVNNAALVFNRSDALTAPNAISGTGSLTKLAGGTLTLSGTTSHSGGTLVSAGRLIGTTSSLQGAITNNAAVTFDQATSGTYTGTMTGSGSLVKSGAGSVTFSGSNALPGGVALNAGTLAVGSANALGASGTISFGGGTLQYTASNAADYSSRFSNEPGQTYSIDTNGRNVTLAAALASSGGALAKLGSGTLTLSGANTYDAGTTVSGGRLVGTTSSLQGAITNNAAVELLQATDGTYAGAMDGTGSLTKSGAGTVTLSGSNSYSGGTTVSAGRLIGTTASLQGPIANAAAVEFAQGGDGTYSAAMSGTGSLTKSGAGALTLSGTNSYSGGTVVAAGRLIGTTASLQGTIANAAEVEFAQAASGTFAGTLSGAGDVFKTGAGMLTINAAQSSTGTLRVQAGTITLGTNGALAAASTVETVSGATLNLGGKSQSLAALSGTGGTIALAAGSLTVNNATSGLYGGVITGSGSLTKQAGGTLTLSGSNTYTGLTTIAAGRLVGSTASLPGAIANASQLEFAQASSGTFASVISGTGSLTKTGAGNLVLSGSSSYSGGTSVAAGRLSVNGILGNSPIAVLIAAELGGSGSIAGAVSIASGGTLSPGNSIESLSVGATSFASGATFEYEVDSTDLGALGAAADLLVVNGNLDIANGTLLSFTDLATTPNPFVEDTTIFALINYSGAWNGGLFSYGANVLADGERFMVGTQQWEIDYNRTSPTGLANFTGDYLPSGSFVAITAVPEPSTLVLAALGTALAAWTARRRVPKQGMMQE